MTCDDTFLKHFHVIFIFKYFLPYVITFFNFSVRVSDLSEPLISSLFPIPFIVCMLRYPIHFAKTMILIIVKASFVKISIRKYKFSFSTSLIKLILSFIILGKYVIKLLLPYAISMLHSFAKCSFIRSLRRPKINTLSFR